MAPVPNFVRLLPLLLVGVACATPEAGQPYLGPDSRLGHVADTDVEVVSFELDDAPGSFRCDGLRIWHASNEPFSIGFRWQSIEYPDGTGSSYSRGAAHARAVGPWIKVAADGILLEEVFVRFRSLLGTHGRPIELEPRDLASLGLLLVSDQVDAPEDQADFKATFRLALPK